jgi:energy-coupling factor transporter ATP-binding protein EcfA2
LLGRNGTGKTVLLEVAAGVLSIGQVSRTIHHEERPPLLVGQYPERLFFADTVAEEVAYAAVKRGITRSEAIDAATRCFAQLNVGGASFLRRRLWELSGGERRMAELVGALVAPSDLLLLDEPTAGLDPSRRAALARLVADRAQAGAVLVATQDLAWAASLGAHPWTLGQQPLMAASHSKKTD